MFCNKHGKITPTKSGRCGSCMVEAVKSVDTK
ncbi:hypothetical protein HWC29_gp154 [Aeromonas phage 4_4572]|uniref:Uncharacterized protein n=1 Tax=Aeromonas phage 4_4572 TaxID=2588517 RepID=A0A5B9N982_9CAUD|nr:hypothetical protein HWC29_gp154 [Aeromonas phage 4_4572]QEG09032.1 hypothetical protein [Aeromonas phage 4_4572]